MSDEESFTPASRLNSDSATSPTCPASATTNPTVTSCQSSSRNATRSSTSGPYASAATSPPTRPPTAPAHVLRGDSTGASLGPPTSVPAVIAHVSHTQVTTRGNTTRATGRTPRAYRARPAPPARRRAPSRPARATAASRRWPGRQRRSAPADCGKSHRDFSEAPIAPLVVEDRPEQVAARHVGPEDGGDVQLGIGELPKQEVRQPVLAGGANQQIGVAPGRGVQLLAQRFFPDVFEPLRPLEHFFGQEAGGARQL